MKSYTAASLSVLCLIASSCTKPQQASVFELRLVVEGPEPGTEQMTLTNKVGGKGQALQEVLHVQQTPIIDQRFVHSSSVKKVKGLPDPYVAVEFTDQGRERFTQPTRQNIGRRLAIVIDGRLWGAPQITTEISDGRVWITGGDLSEKEASDLAKQIGGAAKKRAR